MPYIKLFETSIKTDFEAACALLERENIKYEALYEYRLVSEKRHDPFGNAGAIIRVPRSTYHDADRLLVEHKLKEKGDLKRHRFLFVTKLDKYLSGVPIARYMPLYGKLLGGLMLIGVLLFLWVLLEYDRDFLEPNEAINRFHIERIYFEGKEMIPDTKYDYELVGVFDKEHLSFSSLTNEVSLPGFNSKGIRAKWFFDEAEKELIIFDASSLGDLYNGKYTVKSSFWTNDFTLTSITTRMIVRK
ncbi:MAG: hypothetical protein ACRBG0_09270 [Lewinella sp.]|jgi:hypothetical protein|uniref:hypothetical protein n=1 Tax=Lewinella sp. TaxID=2004506 RepID=UPI003D6B9B74